MKLFLQQENDKNVTFIAMVKVEPPIAGIRAEDALIVSDYTREKLVLSSSIAKAKFRMKALSQDQLKPLIKYSTFLRERRKAGVLRVNIPSAGTSSLRTFYLLPPTVDRNIEAFGVSLITDTELSSALQNGSTSKGDDGDMPSPPPPPPPPSTVISRNSSSSSCSSSTASTRDDGMSLAKKPIVTPKSLLPSRHQVLNAVRELERRIKLDLNQFDQDLGLTRLAFEPMEKEKRIIVHDVVSDYDDLVSRSEGEDITRHVVVYREGHAPELEVDQLEGMRLVPAGGPTARRTAPPSRRGGLKPQAGPLSLAGTVKRDRRTIEEIQRDNKRRRDHT